jgi:hypothetical protein
MKGAGTKATRFIFEQSEGRNESSPALGDRPQMEAGRRRSLLLLCDFFLALATIYHKGVVVTVQGPRTWGYLYLLNKLPVRYVSRTEPKIIPYARRHVQARAAI